MVDIILQSVLKKINPTNILNKIVIFTFPIWAIYRFFPSIYHSLKIDGLFRTLNLSKIFGFIDDVVNILIRVNYIFVFIAIVLFVCYII